MQLPAILTTSLIPTGIKTIPTGTLPWPNGSILSAQLEQVTNTSATLVIAGQRFQVSLPPGLLASLPPQARLWLELINRDAPASLRILNRQQAIQALASRLADITTAKQSDAPLPLQRQHGQPGWSWPDGHPLQAHPSSQGNRLLLDDHANGQPRGMIEQQQDNNEFALHGRLDLDQLGTLYFALQQQPDAPLKLMLRATTHHSLIELQQPFHQWLEQQHQQTPAAQTPLQGQLDQADEPILKPRISASRQA